MCVLFSLQKGRGYHLDLLVAAFMAGLSAVLGFPWILAALVPTLAHLISDGARETDDKY